MASRSLGTLTLDLVAKIGGFTSGLSKAEREADRRLKNIQDRAKRFGAAIGTALGVGISAALTTGVVAVGNAIDRMDELRDASIRLGIGVETLSAFSYAAKQLGTDIDTLGKGFKLLAKNMADAAEGKGKAPIFDALGVSVKDAEGNLKDLEVIVPQLADKISKLEDGTQKAALMLELFGKAGLDLTEFFNQGGDGIQQFIDRARELGLVIDQDAADKADTFKDTLEELKAATVGIATTVAIDLLPVLQKLATTLEGYSKDAANAREVSDFIVSVWETLSGMGHAVSSVFEIVGASLASLAATGKGAYEILLGLVNLDYRRIANGTELIKQAAAGVGSEITEGFSYGDGAADPAKAVAPDFSKVGSNFRTELFKGVTGKFTSEENRQLQEMQDRLNKALGGATGDKGSKKKSGKSDAEREAERIAKAIREMTEAQREWQRELDQTGNPIADDYAKRLAEISDKAEAFAREGVPSDKIEEFKVQMEGLAASMRDKDTLAYLEDFRQQTEDMVASATGASTSTIEYTRAMKALNEELARGIIGQEEYNARADALAQQRDSAANQVLADIAMQRDMLGQTAEYQDTYNKLLWAGVDANSQLGQAIIAANEELHRQADAVQDQVDAMDALRDSVKGLFQDVRDGANVWDALKDAVDRYAAALFDIILNNLVEKALGQGGTAGGGSSGGWISTALGWLFGASGGGGGTNMAVGPRAIGGPVQAGQVYEVTEHGPEMASIGGRDYLLMGSQSGKITPLEATRGGGPVRGGDTYYFQFAAADTQRTVDQAAAVRDRLQRKTRSRNGVRG